MRRQFLDDLPNDFPEHLLRAAYDLRAHGIGELAWRYPIVLDVIDVLAAHDLTILGGEAYRDGERDVVVTGDGWSVKERKAVPWRDYVREAERLAKSYIEAYHARNGVAFWYSLVFVSEQFAEDLFGSR